MHARSMDLELGHTNHQVGLAGKHGIRALSGPDPKPAMPAANAEELKALANADLGLSDGNVVNWHYDRCASSRQS